LAGHTKMAQTGFTPISNYYSATATNVPTAGNLVAGELAINTADGKLFYKDSSGVVQTIASKAGNVNVSSFSGGSTGLTPNTATTGVVTLAGTLAVANGGTGLTSTPANGSLDIGNGTGFTRTTLTAGTGISVTNASGSITIANTSSVNSNQLAKAWVSFAGSTGTISSSYNVSSVTRVSTGIYLISFTSALANANYAYTATVSRGSSWALVSANTTSGAASLAPTTAAFSIATPLYDSSAYTDPTYVYAVVFSS